MLPPTSQEAPDEQNLLTRGILCAAGTTNDTTSRSPWHYMGCHHACSMIFRVSPIGVSAEDLSNSNWRLPWPVHCGRGAECTLVWLEEERHAVDQVVSFASKRLEGAANESEQRFFRWEGWEHGQVNKPLSLDIWSTPFHARF